MSTMPQWFGSLRIPAYRFPLLISGMLLAMLCCGCGGSEEDEKTAAAAAQPVEQTETSAAEAPPKPPEPAKPDPEVLWKEQSAAAEEALAGEEYDEESLAAAQEQVKSLRSLLEEQEMPPEGWQEQLALLESELKIRRRKLEDRRRDELLAEAQKLLDAGDYEGATKALGEVTRQAPTDEQRQQSTAISTEIEQRRRARRELGAWMQLLAHDRSKKEGDVRTAQLQLAQKPEIALPLLMEAVQKADQPHLVANSLELLVQLRRPEQALDSALGVLSRPEQKQNWPDAIRAIERAKQKGAGTLLLKLVLESKDATQRAAALDALAGVPDPPEETVVALLPLLFTTDADLTAALRAVLRAVQVHDQFDLDARRGYPARLTDEQQQQLNDLPGRLKEIIAAAGEGSSEADQEAAQVATTLAVVLRQIAPAPLENLKVLTVVAEEEDGPAAAVLDGVWNSVELNTMWRHPIGSRASIILDLGEVKTVTAVKIWNFNQAGGAYRGWKEAEVYVSETPTALRPVTTGIVLQAPGAADTPDYSTVIPVPAVRGRYLTLKAQSLWNPNTYTGLAEVQVIGF